MTCVECGESPAFDTTGDPDEPWPLCVLCVQQVLVESMELDRDLWNAWEQLKADLARHLDIERGLAQILDQDPS